MSKPWLAPAKFGGNWCEALDHPCPLKAPGTSVRYDGIHCTHFDAGIILRKVFGSLAIPRKLGTDNNHQELIVDLL